MNENASGNAPGDTPRDDLSVEEELALNNEIEITTDSDELSPEYSGDEGALSVTEKEENTEESTPVGQSERLQKLIARGGIASRRAAEELIIEGRVFVNGRAVKELGAKANPQTDRIVVDGKPLILSDKAPTVVLLHKPRGTVTTKSDPEKRATVFDLLPKKFQHLHPIGRLDFDTSGVLLLTDDGDLTHLLTHPSHGIEKVYHARARGEIKTEELKKLESGVWISEGEGSAQRKVKTLRCRARLRAQTESNALVEVALREGRNRQVRKMLESIGHPVSALRRISFAGVELEGLPSGEHRVLLFGEVHALRKRAERALEKAKRRGDKPQVEDEREEAPKEKRESRRASSPANNNRAKTNSSKAHSSKASSSRTNSSRTNSSRTNSSQSQSTPRASKGKPGQQGAPMGERIRREWK